MEFNFTLTPVIHREVLERVQNLANKIREHVLTINGRSN